MNKWTTTTNLRRRRRSHVLFESLESRTLLTANTTDAYANLGVSQGTPSSQVALSTYVRMQTVVGNIDVELTDSQTPITAANFLQYTDAGRWANTFFHRQEPGFVVQAGGYMVSGGSVDQVQSFSPIQNEFSVSRSNLRGTIAMAKIPAEDDQGNPIPGGGPNSATSEWFFNLANNSANLDNQNGGFTTFGNAVNGSMSVVDAIGTLTRVNAGGAFNHLPVVNYSGGTINPDTHLVRMSVARLPVTYNVQSSNPSLVAPSVNGGTLTLNYGAGSGTATVTVVASSDGGANTYTDTFDVTVTAVGVPDIAVSLDGATVNDGDTIDWGAVRRQGPGKKTFTIVNNGGQPLTLAVPASTAAFVVVGPYLSNDTFNKTVITSLAPGASALLEVSMETFTNGSKSQSFAITTNDPDTAAFDLNLTGQVADVSMTVSQNGVPLNANDTINFGTAIVPTALPTITLTVNNTSIVPLVINANQIGNTPIAPGFTVTKSLAGTTIPGNGSDTIILTADTSKPGAVTGEFTLAVTGIFPGFKLLLASTVLAPQIGVTQNALTFNGTSTALAFGELGVGGSAQQSLTVTNSGTSALNLQAITPPAGFTVVQPLPSSLAPQGTATLILGVDSSVAGDKAGTITINSDAFNLPVFSIPVTASVIRGRIEVKNGTTVIASGQTTPIAFAAVGQNGSGQLTLTIKNTGKATLNITPATTTTGFSVVQQLPATLDVDATASLILAVDTAAVGPKNGTLTIQTDDVNTPTFTAPLSATVQGGRIVVTHNGDSVASGQGNPIDFGPIAPSVPAQLTLTITNRPDALAPLLITNQVAAAGFTIVQPLPSSIAIGASADLIVSVDTQTNGVKTGNVLIESNDESAGSFSVALKADVSPGRLGVTVGGQLVDDNQQVDFGTSSQGTAVSRTLVLKNTGATPLNITDIAVPTGFSIVTSPATTLAPGESSDLVIQMTSATAGAQTGTLTITSSDVTTGTYHINLNGVVLKNVTLGVGGVPSVTYTESDGSVVTVKIAGGGSVLLSFTGTITETTSKRGSILTGTNILLQFLTIGSGSTAKTKITITDKGGDKLVHLTQINGGGSADSVNAKNVKLFSGVALAGLRTLVLREASGGSINIGGGLGGLALTVGSITDTDIAASGGIRLAKIGTVTDNNADDLITAPAVTQFTTIGTFAGVFNVTGAIKNFNAGAMSNATLNATSTITKVAVKGAITNSRITAGSTINTITAGGIAGSTVLAGASGTAFPNSLASLPTPAAINLFSVKTFASSILGAQFLKRVSLGIITTSNGGTPFGVAANAFTGSLTGKADTGRVFKLGKLDSPGTVTEGDFQVRTL